MTAGRLERLVEAFGAEGPARGYYRFRCPTHDDSTPSAEVWERDGHLMFGCWICTVGLTGEAAKAAKAAMLKAVGLTWKDILVDRPMEPQIQQRVTARYSYRNPMGEVVYQKLRKEPGRGGRAKDFVSRRPDPENPGKWIYNLSGCRRWLYRLPELLKARHADPLTWVVLCAGEKDADAAAALGFAATTNVEGESVPWQREYSEDLCGANVCVVPDSDPVGWRHAGDAAWSLLHHGCRVRWLVLPGADRDGYDLSDWIASTGRTPRGQQRAALAGMIGAAAELAVTSQAVAG